MSWTIKHIVTVISFVFFLLTIYPIIALSENIIEGSYEFIDQDTSKQEIDLQYPFDDNKNYTEYTPSDNSPIYLSDPTNVNRTIEYNPQTGEYLFYEKIGDFNYRNPSTMTQEEYQNFRFEQSLRQHWRERASGKSGANPAFMPKLKIGGETFDKIFGSNVVNIVPQGEAMLTFGVNISKVDNPALSEELRRTMTFDFKESIKMDVRGTIGDKVEMSISYDTDATFDFENQAKLEYTGNEDEIIKKIEIGNVSLPLSGSLITGSQSLFGIKTQLQFGKLTVTSIFSQQKGNTSVIDVQGGAQTQEFEVNADAYDANRHFFLSHYFRDTYEESLKLLPIINSGVEITQIEVWITNKISSTVDNRDILAFMDLGEGSENIYATGNVTVNSVDQFPSNDVNTLYDELNNNPNIRNITNNIPVYTEGVDYEKISIARKLKPNEYSFNSKLGYISLNSALNSDEILAVSYKYFLNGKLNEVGELSTDRQDSVLVAKLLKGTNLSPRLPTWDLMMKNVYAIGAYQVNDKDFILNILYQDDRKGTSVNYLTEGVLKNEILLNVLNLDNLNSQLDHKPDGRFDFVSGITINPSNGRIIFPVLEPFGSYLEKQFNNPAISEKYVYQELYDSTLTKAQEVAEKNKFKLVGRYQSSASSEIMLNAFDIPQGSVVVTAGAQKLTENVDYTVDYNSGRVTIINQGLLESGQPIRISLESNEMFNLQTKTMLGSHFDYKISENFNMGATILNLTERPLTQKVNIGDEPISNTIWGINGSYKTESPFLTSLVDKLPFLETKETSTITIEGEFAHLIPGHSKAIGKEGTAYIDDFEGSETSYDLKSPQKWRLASTPKGQPLRFPEAELAQPDLTYGYNRAKIAWYTIDQLFVKNNSRTPNHIKQDPESQSSHFVRKIFITEIFDRDQGDNIETYLPVLNLAFYPEERGPYNFDAEPTGFSAGLNSDGTLNNPETRWGGIMSEVVTTDFETSNIQYIEFWLMDPFAENTNLRGGNLYFNLGNISEDILKDSRQSFENGLPADLAITDNIDTTIWGRIPKTQPLSDGFSPNSSGRRNQDVGLDGLSDADEQTHFQTYLDNVSNIVSGSVYNEIEQDPSNDNYHYYRGSDYDAQELGILQRYKNYNGVEGNSLPQEFSTESYSTSGTQYPDIEDINDDNNLNQVESYYQYQVRLNSPEDLEVGQNYIIDKRQSDKITFANGVDTTVTWYQFKIPIYDYDEVIGSIQDFKSIRFMRMFMKEFTDSMILRFATLDLVRAEWRKYNRSLIRGREGLTEDIEEGTFEISSINIEENGVSIDGNGNIKGKYILPPGIDQESDPNNQALKMLNEQSIVLKVLDLQDGDAKAAFKSVGMDIRKYGKIEMEVHAERINNLDPKYDILDDELTAFIRIGSDYQNNYYEYEVPLKITQVQEGQYTDTQGDRLLVWPVENRFNFNLEILTQAKLARNTSMREPGSVVDFESVFPYYDGENNVYVRGNPNLGDVRAIMVGIRNPEDDGIPKSAEVWMNELRLTNFTKKGGWAANSRITARMADFGTLTIAGTKSTPGFGSIEQKVNERSKEDVFQYDISTNLELGKFFPEQSGVSIPMYLGYSESFINPEYYPLDEDILTKDVLKNTGSKHEKDSIKKIVQDYTQRKSINFTNVKINKQSSKPKLYDVSNFSTTYAYSEVYARNIDTEYYIQKSHKGGINYLYTSAPKNIAPLKKVKFLKAKPLQIFRDFNFYYIPASISFRTDMNRYYNAVKARNVYNPGIRIDTTYVKDFIWNRYYDVKFDLTRSLKIDFSATNIARIDEPDGPVDKARFRDQYEHWKDSVISNIKKGGRTTQYFHTINATYNVPINKLPMLDWTNLSSRYSATYGWDAGPQGLTNSIGDPIDVGNTIKNTRTVQLNGRVNLLNLYNKVGALKKINQKYRLSKKARKKSKKKEYKTVTYERKNMSINANVAKSIYHHLMTEDVTVTLTDKNGERIKATTEVASEKKVKVKTDQDYSGVHVLVEGKIEKKDNPFTIIAENTALVLMSLKDINISYSQSEGSTLPGYMPKTKFFGQERVGGIMAPGLPFILGHQDRNFANRAGNTYNWLTQDQNLNTPYQMTYNTNLTFRSTIEPVKGLRIDLNANRTYSKIFSEQYKYDSGNYTPSNESLSGNFSMSFITWRTAFEKISDVDNYQSSTYDQFLNNRSIISWRLGRNKQTDTEGSSIYDPNFESEGTYADGYEELSQDVMIPSFLAAYGKMNAEKITLNPFPAIPFPNWRINFDGLSKINFIKKYFKSINISHVYRSTYSVGSYFANPEYIINENGDSYSRDDQGINFIPEFQINTVSITEQFSPLINVDMTMENNFTLRFGLRKDRTLSLSFVNHNLTEMLSNETIVGLGYRFDEVNLFYRAGGTEKSVKSDLKIQVDLSFKNDITIIRKIAEERVEPIQGQNSISIKSSADYVLSDRFNIQLYFDRMINKPTVATNSFPRATTNIGVSFRFTLVQ